MREIPLSSVAWSTQQTSPRGWPSSSMTHGDRRSHNRGSNSSRFQTCLACVWRPRRRRQRCSTRGESQGQMYVERNARIDDNIPGGAATCSEGFVICFLKVPLACLGSMAAAVQPNNLGNSQKKVNKTFGTSGRPTRYVGTVTVPSEVKCLAARRGFFEQNAGKCHYFM